MSDESETTMPDDLTTIHVPVLVVGAGPAGLATAITLARHGVGSLLVERRTAPSSHPRANVLTVRSMELLRTWGLEREVRAGGVDVDATGWEAPTLAAAPSTGAPFSLGVPTREQSAALSPTAPACVGQDHVEPVLLRHLRGLPGARVLVGTELVDVTVRPDGVEAVVRELGSGRQRRVRAGYLVAADGVRSETRALLGIRRARLGGLADRGGMHFRAPLWELLGERRHLMYVATAPGGEGAVIVAGPPDRWVYAAEVPAAEPSAREAWLRQRLTVALGVPGLEPRVEVVTEAVRFSAGMADRFREGRAFLVGDAAHQATPRGGTGLNTALRDGDDLGWRLSWVLRGWAGDELLDGYEAERRPVAEQHVRRSIDPDPAWSVPHQVAIDLGGRLPHAWLPEADGVSTLDLVGPGLTLLTGPEGASWRGAARRAAGRPPVTCHALDVLTARALGVRGRGALLVRPDGAPVSSWSDDAGAAEALRDAVGTASARVALHT